MRFSSRPVNCAHATPGSATGQGSSALPAVERREVGGSGRENATRWPSGYRGFCDVDPADPPLVESEAALLDRMGVLTAAERRRIPRPRSSRSRWPWRTRAKASSAAGGPTRLTTVPPWTRRQRDLRSDRAHAALRAGGGGRQFIAGDLEALTPLGPKIRGRLFPLFGRA